MIVNMKRIAVFASGSGTNAQNIIEYFSKNNEVDVACILSNKKDAYVLERARKLGIESISFTRDEFYNSEFVLNYIEKRNIDLIVLAGFLWLIPEIIIRSFTGRIINIHPALLPKYGGKGMYGSNVHEAVFNNNDKVTGITIHYVNEKYDDGAIIFQDQVDLDSNESPDTIAKKVHTLEYEHFPLVIEKVLDLL
jgi:phosphoribosylglycinamide formyltransferase 1